MWPRRSAAVVIDDAAITTRIKTKLVCDKDTKARPINVETHDGEVQLSGFAKNLAEKDAAVTVARAVTGVRQSTLTPITTVSFRTSTGIRSLSGHRRPGAPGRRVMTAPSRRSGALALGVLLAFIAWPSAALAPVIAMLAKQLVEQAVTSLIKDTLLNSLNGLGCKGIALSNALNALDGARPGLGALPGMSMPAMPKLPDGMQMPTLPGGALPGMPGMDATMVAGAEAKMRAMMPAGMALDPAQLAMMQDAQTALANPLSPPETVATIDELAELGFLPAEFQTEMKECMVLVPASVPANDRKSFLASLDGGFFPPRVSEGVKARLGAK